MRHWQRARDCWGEFVRRWPLVVEGDPLTPDEEVGCVRCERFYPLGDVAVTWDGFIECGTDGCDGVAIWHLCTRANLEHLREYLASIH